MQNPDIENLIHSVLDSLPTKIGPFGKELEDKLRHGLEQTLKKMDLVTRHEFDIQTAVLQRTREKLEKIEQQLNELEKKSGK